MQLNILALLVLEAYVEFRVGDATLCPEVRYLHWPFIINFKGEDLKELKSLPDIILLRFTQQLMETVLGYGLFWAGFHETNFPSRPDRVLVMYC